MNEPLLMQVYELLKGCHFQWAFCGGYAIDLLLNQTTRKHGDIDICVFEDDRESIIDHMLTTEWNVYQFLGGGKVRRILPGDASDNGRNLMCVKDNCALVTFHPCDENNIFWYEFHHTGIEKLDYLEFMFNQTDGNELVITSAPMAKRPLKKAFLYNGTFPYLAPEIALLYKASNADQPEYQQDYEYSFPRLNIEQAEWLQKNLQMRYPQGHRWLNTGC